jgi:hypothetical protein
VSNAPIFEVVTITNGDFLHLEHTISSVLAQNNNDFVYTILNGGASSILPMLPAYMLSDLRLRVIDKPDRSLWEGMNNAIDAAKGSWLLFMNAGDMFFDRHTVSRMIEAVRTQPDADVHYFDWCTFARSDDGRLLRLLHRRPDPLELVRVKLPFCHQAVWTRTELLRKYHFTPVKSGQRQALDHGLYLRLWTQGARFTYHPFITAYYAVGGLSDTRRMQALLGNALNTLHIAERPFMALGYLAYQTAIQALALGPRMLRASKQHFKPIKEAAGAVVEAATWLRFALRRSEAAKVSALKGSIDSLAVLVQYDDFAHSVADWVRLSSLIGQRTELLVSRRYGFKATELRKEAILVEDVLTARIVGGALLNALRWCISNNTLSGRGKAQVNSSVIRRFPGKLGHQIPFFEFHRGRSLLTYLLMNRVGEQILSECGIGKILINDLSYSHNYAFIKAAFDAAVPVFYYSTGFRSDQLFMRSVLREDDLIHCVTSPEVCCNRNGLPLHDARQAISAYYQECMGLDTYAGARGGWSSAGVFGDQRLSQRFNTDKNIIVIFSHVLFDANGAYGVDLFSSMEAWLRETLAWYSKFGPDDCFVVVKEHPANKFKVEAVNGKRPVCSERLIFDELELGQLPSRFGFLADEDQVPTSQVLHDAAGIITVRGSVAVEAAAHGIPVLVAGSSRFTNRGFVNEPHSQLEYFLALNNFFKISKQTRGRLIAKATRYAECTLYCGGVSTAPWLITHESGSKPRLVERTNSTEKAP